MVNEVTDSLSSAVQDFKDIIPEQPTGSAGLPGSDQDLTAKKEQLKNLGLQDDLIEKLISFTKKQDEHQPVAAIVTEEQGGRKLLNIAITKGNEILSESMDLAEDYYGLGNVPDEVIDKIYSGKLAYINAEGKLDIADQPNEQFKNHQYLIELGVKSSKLVNVTEEFMAKHGGEASAVLVAMDVLSGGGLSAGKNLFKGVVGEKIFGELIEHGKEVAHEKLQTAIEKRFPYLSKHHSDALATILLTGGAITVGIGADFLKGGIRVGKRIDHPTPEMLADNYHPDWKFYKGTDYRDVGSKKVDGPNGSDYPESAANNQRLKNQLLSEEAYTKMFNADGSLKKNVIDSSEEIIEGIYLNNANLIKSLTKDGSNIVDWGKYTTLTEVNSPSGRFEVHFYKNKVTGKIHYEEDYKSIFKGTKK